MRYKAPDFWRFFAFSLLRLPLARCCLVRRGCWLGLRAWVSSLVVGPGDDDTVGGGCGREDGVERVSL